MPVLLTRALGWVVGFGAKRLLIGAATAAAAAAAVWLWNDYQYRGLRIAELRREAELADEAHQKALYARDLVEAQLRADLVAQRDVVARRTREASDLRTSITKLEDMERPDDQASCPVHPAIGLALDELRQPAGE